MMEGKTTEFKREYVDDIRYTVVAFANTDGGKIYIGINDDGSVQGIDNVDQYDQGFDSPGCYHVYRVQCRTYPR